MTLKMSRLRHLVFSFCFCPLPFLFLHKHTPDLTPQTSASGAALVQTMACRLKFQGHHQLCHPLSFPLFLSPSLSTTPFPFQLLTTQQSLFSWLWGVLIHSLFSALFLIRKPLMLLRLLWQYHVFLYACILGIFSLGIHTLSTMDLCVICFLLFVFQVC